MKQLLQLPNSNHKTILMGICVLFIVQSVDLNGQYFQQAPVNPTYLKFINNPDQAQAKSADGHGLGLIPEFYLPNFGKTPSKLSAVSFPSVYDLRTAGPGGTSLLTSVKDQGSSCESCWTFATMGAIEGNAIKTGKGDYDLSENNLKECHGFAITPCNPGNREMSSAYLARKSGPISEIYDPYIPNAVGCTGNLYPEFWIENIRYIPTDADIIKQTILDNGATASNMFYNDSYYNSTDNTYYCNVSQTTNHAVLLVGWDDSKITSGGTGAWIIKNSWGAQRNENGFFYVSYNDKNINSVVISYQTLTNSVPNSIKFGYCKFGMLNSIGANSNIGYGLIRFSPGAENITLKKLSTFVPSVSTIISFEVYDDFNGTTLSNLLGSISDKTCDFPGYYTFDLTTSISIAANNDFYVKVFYNVSDITFKMPIPVEIALPGPNVYPVIESGKCWVSTDGSIWTAIGSDKVTKADLCINAYAESSCTPPAAPTIGQITQPTCSEATGKVELNGLPSTGTWILNPGNFAGTGITNSITVFAARTYSFTVTNSSGCTSSGSENVVMNAQPVTPAQPGAITGSTVVCDGVPQIYNISDVTGATSYTWILPSGWSGSSTTTSISATPGAEGGTISVIPNSICGSGIARTLNTTVTEIPGQPGAITGSISTCMNVNQIYSIASVTGATSYTWSLPSGWSGSSTSTSITATPGAAGGTISVTADNLCGPSISSSISVTSTVIPGQPGDITGNTAICQGAAQTYSIADVTDATSYTWTLPSGWSGSSVSTSITATPGATGGTISVKATSSCGSGTARTLSVTVTRLPGQPGTISGTASVCQGAVQTFSIGAVTGAISYTWTLPSGWSGNSTTTSIATIAGATGGTISVTANNTCGSGTARTFSITVPAIPEKPGIITGNITVCTLTSNTYSIAPVPGATSYTWSMPSGWSGFSTSSLISSSAGSTGGTISVTANNSCGSSEPSSLSVTSRAKPATPGTITGNTPVCQGSDQTYSIADVTDATSYTWTLPSGWSGSSTSSSISATPGTNGGTISVKATNVCGSGTSRTLTVVIASKPTITTSVVDAASPSTAEGGGNITSNGGSELTERGVCWSLAVNPTTADVRSSDGTSTGQYASTITGLTNGVTYHVRAYATNCTGTGYGSDILYTHNPTDIYDVKTEEISVFPNPVAGVLNIEYKNDSFKSVSIINSQGTLLFKETVNTPRQQLDFSKYQPGLYFIELTKTTGEIRRFKIINHK